MTRRWGSSAVPDGKVVWCVLHPTTRPSDGAFALGARFRAVPPKAARLWREGSG
ncbi:hypothetical protein NKG94_42445 [Micromonospora sp. M12]